MGGVGSVFQFPHPPLPPSFLHAPVLHRIQVDVFIILFFAYDLAFCSHLRRRSFGLVTQSLRDVRHVKLFMTQSLHDEHHARHVKLCVTQSLHDERHAKLRDTIFA